MKKSNIKVIDHFNQIAPCYDSYKKRNPIYYNTLKNATKELITRKSPLILDIGCGTGEILHFLNPKYGLGIDHSSQMIKIAKKKFRHLKNLTFGLYDIEKKPVSGNFDYILLIDVVEHIYFLEKAIYNIQKTMSKKTKLIVSMANPIWEPILFIMEMLNLKMPEGPHSRISEKEFFALLKKYHLIVTQKKYFLPSLPFFKQIALIYLYTIQKR